MRVVFSEHARERCKLRGVNMDRLQKQIETIPPVLSGQCFPWYFSKGLKVVIQDKEDTRYVITVVRKGKTYRKRERR